MTSVSVVIPCFQSAPWLEDAIASVVAQTRAALEIVLVDDGSTDDTPRVIEELARRHAAIRTVARPNGGVASARNLGISISRGEYVLPLDADDAIEPAMIETCAAMLDEDPRAAIVYTDRRDFGELEGVFASGRFELARLRYFNQLAYCALYRRDVWLRVGGYRTNVSGFDDWDFWVAASLAGFEARHVAQPLFRHRRRKGSQLGGIIDRYETLFAQIVLNNASAYATDEVAAAERFLATGRRASFLQISKRLFLDRYPIPA